MPIAFPSSSIGPDYDAPENALAVFAPRYGLTNLGAVGSEFDSRFLNPGFPIDQEIGLGVNLLNLGSMYEAPGNEAKVNPVPVPVGDPRFSVLALDYLNMTLSGVSKDSTGVALGNCQVLVFTTQDKRLVAETTSDGSGVWSVPLMVGGPFFLVEYKAGSPDVAGTSVNTLVPVKTP